jgi:hypothetical protein
MRVSKVPVGVGFFMVLVTMASPGENPSASQDECALTAHSRIYSNAVFIEEAGDVVGFELALQRDQHRASVDALLYDYEGVPVSHGITLSGQSLNGRLTVKGTWRLPLVKQPSKEEIVETRLVALDGTIDSTRFRGTITIEGNPPIRVRLKRVDHIWMCKRQTNQK